MRDYLYKLPGLAILLIVLGISPLANALEWKPMNSGRIWADTFKVYYATRRDNTEIRYKFRNVTSREVNVGNIEVTYSCRNGSQETNTHYFSHSYDPGETYGFVGFDGACKHAGGFTYIDFKSCNAGYKRSCFD